MSDLLELCQQNQNRELARSALEGHLRRLCRQVAPAVFEKLAREIDRDLLYTEEKELVLPKIREAACKVLHQALNEDSRVSTTNRMVGMVVDHQRLEDSSRDPTTNMMVEMLVEQTWLVMGLMRSAERIKRTYED